MALWFSASALVPQLTEEWGLGPAGRSWLTMSVQLGFVLGAVVSAVLNLPDRAPVPKLIAAGAGMGALANAGIMVSGGPECAILLRMITGAALALVYPPGMKLIASWCREDRGFGIGLLVGALTIGSGLPHLIAAVPGMGGGLPPWRAVIAVTSLQALAAAGIAIWALRSGPHLPGPSPFSWTKAGEGLLRTGPRLANLGYFGHMWELYAMWTWVPIALIASYSSAGLDPAWARVAAFLMMVAGGIAAVGAGRWADRWGRTLTTTAALTVSGACCLLAGSLVGMPAAFTALAIIWGAAVIADSAQFSAAVSELSDRAYVGTALTVQTAIGFLLTLVSIRLVAWMELVVGWEGAFYVLALGPVLGAWSMLRLRGRPEARSMASGNR